VQTATNPEIETSVARTFPAEAMSATSARHFVVAMLEPLVRDDLVAVAALLTTELATNSVLHARSAIDVHVEVSSDRLRVEVCDAHPERPRRRRADPFGTFGRGLALVDHLSDRWGVSPRSSGKGVWFTLDL
jgi:anti-sigma regulatory factor (Ser/Thr protein kinase)